MPDENERNYHVGFAKATFDGLFDEIGEAINESWKPGASVTRYNRRWHLSKIVHETNDLYFGRIGFVSDNEVSTLRFDPQVQDFVYGEAPSGYVVPFVVRKSDGVIAFQLYPGVVRETTFTGALQDLLNSASEIHVWRVSSFVETRSFDEWMANTEGILKFDFTLERPNPNYRDRPIVEELIEDTRVETLRLIGKALEGETVAVDADAFRQALDHVLRDYGKGKLTGLDPAGAESTWEKVRGTIGRVASERSIRGIGPDEAPEGLLREILVEAPVSAELAEPNSHADEG